ncbi:MAG: EAL domain-containing protein [Rhizobiaceae bacterium]|nr:EAL domain-containing protein [Rhizobiaceae bacterium]
MRIRSILMISFLFATLVPSVLYGLWSYNQGLRREFSEVRERHLLIAENLGYALERYYLDVSAAFDSISAAMVAGRDVPRLPELMDRLHIDCIVVVSKVNRAILASEKRTQAASPHFFPAATYEIARQNAVAGLTTFSPVIAGVEGRNEILAIHDYGDTLAIARIETDYFVRLGKSVAFGEKGHAAIVDQAGNVLAHPLPDWIAERKNIAKVSAVQRMMAGETGIEQFYSPALKGDMIAGLTSVTGPGWGVMVPQPVSELYDKVLWSNITILGVLGAGLALSLAIVALLMRSLVWPLEKMVQRLKSNAHSRQLQLLPIESGLIPIRELVNYEHSYNRMVGAMSEANLKIRELAYTDAITGLPNRARFQLLAEQRLSEAAKNGGSGALIYLDLDDFKGVNDLFGHDIGDKYLKACAERLQSACRHAQSGKRDASPIVARVGGDEFVLMLPGVDRVPVLRSILNNLQKEISLLADEMGLSIGGSASLGSAFYPKDATTVDGLMKLADIAMYRAKTAGKNKTEIFKPNIGRLTVAEVRQGVLDAIANEELTLEYQPNITTSDWSPNGAEALVRWDHPVRGRIGPDAWLPAIAQTDIIDRLGEWVIDRAIADYPIWAGDNGDLKLAVNFGSRHFVSRGFADWLGDRLADAGFDSSRLVVEVTEDALMSSADKAPAVLAKLKDLGISIAIDDFGKGYSNIARLAELPVDQIKIDRSIVVGAPQNERLRSIMRCILHLGRELGCETVAEGVETLRHADFMAKNGADILQGYYFAKSLPPAELAEWIKSININPVHQRRRELTAALRG